MKISGLGTKSDVVRETGLAGIEPMRCSTRRAADAHFASSALRQAVDFAVLR
jgi:hypothetical protein